MKKVFLVLALSSVTALLGCGDDQDPRISDDDALCLKMIRAGGSCGTSGSTSTVTTTATSTVTITSTSTSE